MSDFWSFLTAKQGWKAAVGAKGRRNGRCRWGPRSRAIMLEPGCSRLVHCIPFALLHPAKARVCGGLILLSPFGRPSSKPQPGSLQGHTSYSLLVLLRAGRPFGRTSPSLFKPSARLSSGSYILLIINSSQGKAPIRPNPSLLR